MPTDNLTTLANRFGTDKGDAVLCAHCYTQVYDTLLGPSRRQPIRMLEIGLMHGHTQTTMADRLEEVGCPSLKMWAEYLPAAYLCGLDIVDFRFLSEPRMQIFKGDQGKPEDLLGLAERAGGPFDVIIDDGSHASHHQQISLANLFSQLAPGGLYCIEDMHYQPEDLEIPGIATTREWLRDLRFGRSGSRVAVSQQDLASLLDQIASIHFFDSRSSRWPLNRTEDALAVIVKRGAHPWFDETIHAQLRTPTNDRGKSLATQPAQRPESFLGHTAIHGQHVFSGSRVALDAPTYLVVTTLTPGFTALNPCMTNGALYVMGDDIDFRLGGNASNYLRKGWDFSSTGGCWTLAPVAHVAMRLHEPPPGGSGCRLEILGQALVNSRHPGTEAEISVNGRQIGSLAFGHESWQILDFPWPAEPSNDGDLVIAFRPLNATSPRALGISEDARDLGILLVQMRISRLHS